jgi:Putative Na+/H+ antiporter
VTPTSIQIVGAALFAVAILHTFSTKFFEHLANTNSAHAGLWHLLGEVEVVFGFWALILIFSMFALNGSSFALSYVNTRNFSEPMFVFAIMVITGTRPILRAATASVQHISRLVPLAGGLGFYLVVMILVPLLGSFITEPAAMTLAAMILADHFFARGLSSKLMYATLGVLLVNISIGGTLTPFAAPPILMVAGKWGWDIGFMMTTFGWKAAIAVVINSVGVAILFRKELAKLTPMPKKKDSSPVPITLTVAHLFFLAGVVIFSHYPAIFMGLLLFFLGMVNAYKQYQDRLILREGLMVAFFLAGLVVFGEQQQWWLRPILMSMSKEAVFFGSTFLTAFTDNAAVTYLASLVDGLSEGFKYALVAGAVTGGGLTIIANAPNPSGIAILRGYFDEGSVHPMGLFLAALLPTLVAGLAFCLL